LPDGRIWHGLRKDNTGLTALLEGALVEAMDTGLIVDAMVSSSEAQTLALWKLREAEGRHFAGAGACR
jgi:hypothetical protein